MSDTPLRESGKKRHGPRHVWRYILIGFFTVAPLWVTWLVLDFLFSLLAKTGAPILRAAARGVNPASETLSQWLLNPAVQYVLAALVTLVGLHLIGLLTSMVVGRQIIAFLERQLDRLPMVETIYRTTKRFLQSVQAPPMAGKRVCLINFPSPEMRAIGFITKVMTDENSGRELAAVYVPTSPNPTSGYIEIVPIEDVILTDWTMEEALSFVVTGGINSPDQIRFSDKPPTAGNPE